MDRAKLLVFLINNISLLFEIILFCCEDLKLRKTDLLGNFGYSIKRNPLISIEKDKGNRNYNLHWADLFERKFKNVNKYLSSEGVRRSPTDLTGLMSGTPLTFPNFMKH